MWIIFRDPETIFLDMDKYIVDMIADDDILPYQTKLLKEFGGHGHEVQTYVYFMQPFVTASNGTCYFIRKFKPWSQN